MTDLLGTLELVILHGQVGGQQFHRLLINRVLGEGHQVVQESSPAHQLHEKNDNFDENIFKQHLEHPLTLRALQ